MTEPRGPSIAVVGAGAVGGYFGGRLAAAGHDVRFLARGENLAALRRAGLRVTNGSTDWSVPGVRASDDPDDIGQVDYVLLCVKTSQLPATIDTLGPLVGETTAVVTVQNGVEAPEQVAAAIGRDRVLPGLVRVVATTVGPGEIRHVGPPGALGFAEWDSGVSDRVTRLREVLRDASVTVPEPSDIWADLWAKFLLVAPIGSLGAATGGATIGELRSRPGTRNMLIAGMGEIYETGIKLGIELPADSVDTATELMDRQSPDVTSSLQRDILAGRPSELEAWTGAVVRLAGRAGLSAPVHEMLYELLAMRQITGSRP
ncbi:MULTISPECIES: 2-dehydropantoate 2-reductase [unclassified Streptomyces]|uniref:2-dehydropantoate 2-reductase n=1 Tax=unclassified Streptomyces TaxID=2593676 RepID=UPI001BE64A33|nr:MULTISPECIES: 2-dehydropantoate 2-reductase [unclassified Streptomyces]MBT2407842.1 2-dehydropantoate 2-reductase [Streptomyces sp. ISL-21]MBT2608468.1 2-dehydropantoate 2-reductase [Streptomyces sp. ISL-87]